MAANPRANIQRVKDATESFAHKLELISARVKDPEQALYTIAEEFSLMEAERFKTGGKAPEWGITSQWEPLSAGFQNDIGDNFASTVAERFNKGGNGKNQPLVNFGYLANAAIDPQFESFGQKSLNLVIDPSNRAPIDYSRGTNYGIMHQDGIGVSKREFVTITPEFVEISAKIVKYFLLEGVITQKEAKKYFTPMDKAAGKRARKSRSDLRRRAALSDRKHGSITKVEHFGESGIYRSATVNTFKTPRRRKA